MKPARILVVGSANIDLVTNVPRSPKPGESLIGSGFKTVPGGKGANQAVAAARLGAKTWFAGCVGNDGFGDIQRSTLSNDGIDLTFLKTHPTEPTGTAVILVADNGQNSIVVVPSANYGYTPGDAAALGAIMGEVDAVLMQLEIPLATVEAVLELALEKGVTSILDAGPAQRVPESILRTAAVVSPNETEAEAITGIAVSCVDDAARVAARLHEMGAREVVLKLGANGAFYSGIEQFHVPAFPVKPVDTTAAGDAFTAALGRVWKCLPPRKAVLFANAVGALATTVAGAQPSMPTVEAVRAFMKERGVEDLD